MASDDDAMNAGQVRVDYEYIKRHQRVWESELARLAGEIAKTARQVEWQHTQVRLLQPLIATHERVVDVVRGRADEGVTAQYDIAHRLAEIVAYYQTEERLHSALMATGGTP